MRKSRVLPLAVRTAMSELKEALLAIYGDRLKAVYLYGSYARGDYDEASDVDILIVLGDEVNPWREIDRISKTLGDISLRHDVLISSYPVPEAWLRTRQSPLFRNVRKEGIRV